MATVSASTLMHLARFCYAHVMCPSASTAVTIAISSAEMLRERHFKGMARLMGRLCGMLRERHGQACGPTTWHAEEKAWPAVRSFKRQDAEGKAWQTRVRDMLRERHGQFHVFVAC